MKLLFKIVKFISLLIIGMIAIFVLIINIIGTRSNLVNGVTAEKIKQVQPGMTLQEVEAILGRPFRINSLAGLHDMKCPNPKPTLDIALTDETDIKSVVDNLFNDTIFCCEGNKEDKEYKSVTLTYSRPVKLSKYYPMLWVHLDSSYKVFGVYAKRYEGYIGYDDPAIYSLYWEAIVDTTTLDLHFTNNIDKYIDEQKFAECFK